MDFLKGDFPFVVAFLAVHGHHRIQGSTILEAQQCGILDGLFQVVASVYEQLSRHIPRMGSQIERQTVCLRVPITCSPVFLTCESPRADVQARVVSREGLVEMEDVEAYGLLGRVVSIDRDVRTLPDALPRHHVVLERCAPALCHGILHGGCSPSDQLVDRMVHSPQQRNGLVQNETGSGFHGRIHCNSMPLWNASATRICCARIQPRGNTDCMGHIQCRLSGPDMQEASVIVSTTVHMLPEPLFPIGVLIAHFSVKQCLH